MKTNGQGQVADGQGADFPPLNTQHSTLNPLRILQGDCRETLKTLAAGSVQCCVTSPPYWGLRDYGTEGLEWPEVSFVPVAGLPPVTVPAMRCSLGLEREPWAFVGHLVLVFREVWRVLAKDGTLWLNLGDSYATGNRDTGFGKADTGKSSLGAGYKGARNGAEGKHGYMAPGASWVGPMSQPNRMPLAGLKAKDLLGMPWRVALALQAEGWWLRSDIVWHKPNPMPESVTDRPTKAHEYLFLLGRSEGYYYDQEAIAEAMTRGDAGSSFCDGKTELHQLGRSSTQPRKQRKPAGWDTGEGAHGTIHRDGRAKEIEYTEEVATQRNKRTVWTVPTFSFAEAHFATYPPELIRPCIRAGSRPGDVVLDPFGGSGTTGQVALEEGRRAVLCELNPAYVPMIEARTNVTRGLGL